MLSEYMPFTTTTRVEIKESEPMPGLEGADELFKPTGRGDTKPTDRGDTKRATETKESWINVQTTTEPVKSELSFRVKVKGGTPFSNPVTEVTIVFWRAGRKRGANPKDGSGKDATLLPSPPVEPARQGEWYLLAIVLFIHVSQNVSALWVPQPESDSLVETNFGTNWERFVGDDILGPMTEALTHIRINCKNTSIRDMPLERMLQSSTLRTALSGIIKV